MFNIYNPVKRNIEINAEIPYLCQKYIDEGNKKCINFYQKVIDEDINQKIYLCPYGFCAYKTENSIYTSLIILNKSNFSKIIPNLKRFNQDVKQFTQYSLSQIVKIISEYEELKYENQVRRLTIHDIKNAIKHFIDLVEEVKSDDEVIRMAQSNDKLFSSVEGYSLIQYRLSYHDKLLNYGDGIVEKGYINFHQAITKLSKLLMYRGIKKGVKIHFNGYLKRSFHANKDLYLMYYILIENALKFALENTAVDISFGIDDDVLRITIANCCYHLDPDEMDKLFISGYRGIKVANNSEGHGLGLALAKKIADISNVQLHCNYVDTDGCEKGIFTVECIHMMR